MNAGEILEELKPLGSDGYKKVMFIHQAPDLARYQMNSFIIEVGSCVLPLTDDAIQAAEKIGPVNADLGNNSCQVPFAPASIERVRTSGAIGKKRKSAKC